jgi:hypothetical protein
VRSLLERMRKSAVGRKDFGEGLSFQSELTVNSP